MSSRLDSALSLVSHSKALLTVSVYGLVLGYRCDSLVRSLLGGVRKQFLKSILGYTFVYLVNSNLLSILNFLIQCRPILLLTSGSS
jgi:hypothetical protein